MELRFDHEKLDVYQEAIVFASWADQLVRSISPKAAACEQLDRASTSVALNIAEGNGKYSARDRCRFLDTAYGSAAECAACLDVLAAKGLATTDGIRDGKDMLQRIVSMLVRLRESIADRLRENEVEYKYE